MSQFLYRACLIVIFSGFLQTSLSAQLQLPDTTSTLAGALQVLETQTDYRFSYRPETIAGLSIRPPKEALPVEELLSILLKPHFLQFEPTGTRAFAILRTREQLTLRGTILSESEPLVGASISNPDGTRGATTDIDGIFQIEVSPYDTLTVSYLGFEIQTLLPQSWRNRRTLEIELIPIESTLSVHTISGEYLIPGTTLDSTGEAVKVRLDATGPLPGRPDVDILAALRSIPGVSMSSGSSESWSVRGSTAGQNLLTYEGIPVYHTGHYFGLISALDGRVANRLRVLRGDRRARYGDRIGGRAELSTARPRETGIGVHAGLLHTGVNARWRSSLERSSTYAVASLRSSYGAWWRSPAYEALSRRVQQGELLQVPTGDRLPPGIRIEDAFRFRDGMLKVGHRTSVGTFSVSGFGATNYFESSVNDQNIQRRQLDTFDLTQYGASLQWQHSTEIADWSAIAYTSRYRYDYTYSLDNQQVKDRTGEKRNDLAEYGWQFRSTLPTGWELGYQGTQYQTDFKLTRLGTNSLPTDLKDKIETVSHALYGQYATPSDRSLGARLGLRLAHFSATDRVFVLPRLHAYWKYRPGSGQFFLSGGSYRQFISRLVDLTGDPSGISTPLWVPAGSPMVPVLRSDQATLGWQHQIDGHSFEVQTYLRRLRGLTSSSTEFTDGIDDGTLLVGDAHLRGLDALVKMRFGPWRIWTAYSYLNARYRFPRFYDKEFTPQSARPHNGTLTIFYRRSNWQWSVAGQYLSGIAYTDRNTLQPKRSPAGNLVLEPLTNRYNDRRFPASLRVDCSARYRWTARGWRGSVGVSYYNLLGTVSYYERGFFIRVPEQMEETPELRYLDRADVTGLLGVEVRVEF